MIENLESGGALGGPMGAAQSDHMNQSRYNNEANRDRDTLMQHSVSKQ